MQLTCVQVAVDALLRDAVKSLDVVVAVPDPQLLSRHQRPTHSEVDVCAALKRRQVPVALVRRGPDKPAGQKHGQEHFPSLTLFGVWHLSSNALKGKLGKTSKTADTLFLYKEIIFFLL